MDFILCEIKIDKIEQKCVVTLHSKSGNSMKGQYRWTETEKNQLPKKLRCIRAKIRINRLDL